MLLNPTPTALLDQQAKVLRTQLDGVYDGRVDAVHDARVATRRIRELISLAPPVSGEEAHDDLAEAYKDVGRALGRVRDIDVQIGLIRDLERHAPQTAPSLVLVRQDHERDRLAGMRRLIKTLERLDVEAVLGRITTRHPSGARNRLSARAWRDHLRQLLLERAGTAAEKIAHATGVYFPNRSHTARIAVKKLRYAAEISEATGSSHLKGAIKSLRKGQEVLGEMHDRAALSDTLASYVDRDHVNADHIALATRVLEGEILDLHARYLARRSALCEACAEIERLSRRGSKAAPALAVGGGILVAGIAYLKNRTPQTKQPLVEVNSRVAV
jgi:CHAD domain-containing protein